MNNQDFTATISVDKTPKEAFDVSTAFASTTNGAFVLRGATGTPMKSRLWITTRRA